MSALITPVAGLSIRSIHTYIPKERPDVVNAIRGPITYLVLKPSVIPKATFTKDLIENHNPDLTPNDIIIQMFSPAYLLIQSIWIVGN